MSMRTIGLVFLLLLSVALLGGRPRPGPAYVKAIVLYGVSASTGALPNRIIVNDAGQFEAAVASATCGTHIDVYVPVVLGKLVRFNADCLDPEALAVRVDFHNNPFVAELSVEAGTGWVSIEKAACVNGTSGYESDCFQATDNGSLAVLGSSGNAGGGPYDNVMTAHDDGRLLVINTDAQGVGAVQGPVVAPVHFSRMTWIGTDTIAGVLPVTIGGGGFDTRVTMVGPTLVNTVPGNFAIDFSVALNGVGSLKVAKVHADAPFDWDGLSRMDVQGYGSLELIQLDVAVPAWVMGTRIEILQVQ